MGNNLLGVLLTRSLECVEVHDSVAVITVIATMVVIVGAHGLLVVGLLVLVVMAKDCLILLAELSGLLLTWLSREARWSSKSRTRYLRVLFLFTILLLAARRW
jgi:type IV secretory pathway VirB3-like protein